MNISEILKNVTKTHIQDYYDNNSPTIEDSTYRYEISNWCFKSNIFSEIRKKYQEKQRFYHNENHLNELISLVNFLKTKKVINEKEQSKLYIIAFFHDAVYNPKIQDNEEQSANLFLDYVVRELEFKSPEFGYTTESKKNIIKQNHEFSDDIFEIYQAILDTKTHKSSSGISTIFCSLDLFCLTNYNLSELIEYEHNIFKEYQFIDILLYHEKRLEVLQSFLKEINNPNLQLLIEYVKHRKVKIGLYPGSFKPYHIGHLDILQKAELVLDKVVICTGINPSKTQEGFESKFDFVPYREIKNFQNYQIDFLDSLNKEAREYEKNNKLGQIVEYVFIRGLRNFNDFNLEYNQLQYNKLLAKDRGIDLNTIFFISEPEFQHISSSDIRAMENFKPGSAKKLIV